MSDILIRDTRIVPLADAPVTATDIRITGGVISEIGPNLAGNGELEVQADGRWAIPGLWDAHIHATQWVKTAGRIDLNGTTGPEDVLARVQAHLRTHNPAPGTIIQGYGYRSSTWQRPALVAELDQISGDYPVILISGDAHNGWLNSAAFALLDVPAYTGAISENEWFALLPKIDKLPAMTPSFADCRDVFAAAAARGITGIVDFEFADAFIDWPERIARGIDFQKVRCGFYPNQFEQAVALGLPTGAVLPDSRGLATLGPLKVISDGSLGTRTAWCDEPYLEMMPDCEYPCGKANYSEQELFELLTRAKAHGFTAAFHAIGDAANARVIEQMGKVGISGSVEHAQLLRREDIALMVKFGLRASVQPAHLYDDRDAASICWADRTDRLFMFRSLEKAGVPLDLGSDAPVSALDPWLQMAAAVHRSSDQREPWHPEEAISVRTALLSSVDGQRICLGGPGDLVLIEENPLSFTGDTGRVAKSLRNMVVYLTVRSGTITHSLVDC